MRKLYFLLLLLLLIGTKSNAQITLVNTFSSGSCYMNISPITYIDGTQGFIGADERNNKFKVFNADFSLNREITFTISNFYSIEIFTIGGDHGYVCGTSHLFNDNASLEFIVRLKDAVTGKYGFAIVDENNNIIFSKYTDDASYSITSLSCYTTKTKAFLKVEYYKDGSYQYEVYSLPGTERFDCCSSSSTPTGTVSPIERFMTSPSPIRHNQV